MISDSKYLTHVAKNLLLAVIKTRCRERNEAELQVTNARMTDTKTDAHTQTCRG